MQREELIDRMLSLLVNTLAEHGADAALQTTVTSTSPLIGGEAVVTSLGLVSFITDVESTLAETEQVELTLVNEQALSRKNSPFRTVETLADYVLELAGAMEPDAAPVPG